MKKLFIGIDFSKKTIDVSFFETAKTEGVHYCRFDNSKDGFNALVKWVGKNTEISKKQWLFCGEHTGLYSLELSSFYLA